MKNKKIIIIIGIILLIAIICCVVFFFTGEKNTGAGPVDKVTGYDEVLKIVNNKEDGIIYYYNSRSNNTNNLEIKEYLDELKIKYYAYDDANVGKEEYKKFITLTGIPDDIFGMPALIYIENGEIRSNIINIDSKELVKTFLENYGLYV